jgi:hypothetical protein
MRAPTVALAVAVALAAAAACAPDDTTNLTGARSEENSTEAKAGGATGTDASAEGAAAPPTLGPPGTPQSPAGKAFFAAEVHPSLAATCGSCHDSGPGPVWLSRQDADKTYTMMFALGYVTKDSRILAKGSHSGGAAPALTPEQTQKIQAWLDLEISAVESAGGTPPPNVLEALASCLDPARFGEIGLDTLVTTPRAGENANECTGCNGTPCRSCHSSDPASGFVMAIGNTVLPDGYTFDETKKTDPPYLQKYFGVSPAGDPVPSKAIRIKSDSTATGSAYTHPMFVLPAELEARLNGFVDDAIARYQAGACPGMHDAKRPAPHRP